MDERWPQLTALQQEGSVDEMSAYRSLNS